MSRLLACAVTFLVLSPAARPEENTKEYTDPDKAFSIHLPAGWKVERVRVKRAKGTWQTNIKSDKNAASLVLMTSKVPSLEKDPPKLKAFKLEEGSKMFFQGWHAGLKEYTRLKKASKVYKTKFDEADALRMDVRYAHADNDEPRQGYAVFLFGKRTGFFIAVTGDKKGAMKVEKLLATLKREPNN